MDGQCDISQFNKNFIKKYNKDSNLGFFIEVDIQYLEKYHELHDDLTLSPERMKIGTYEKRAGNMHDKKLLFAWEN